MVSERAHEIGVRLALGAQPGDVLRLVMRQGLSLAIAGGALGLAGALIASRAIASLLVGVRPTDLVTYVAAAGVLTIVAVAGCLLPAWRAVHVDLVATLRN